MYTYYDYLQDNCFIPVKLPTVYLPSVDHICEAKHRRVVTLFHIEGEHVFWDVCKHVQYVMHSQYSHIHTYIHTYIHTHAHTHAHTHMHAHTYIHTYIHTHTHMHTHMHTHTHAHTYIHTYIHTHTHMHTHTHTHTHSYIHTYIHVHMYTYILLGIPRHVEVGFCKCKNDTLTLVELGYWPATPSRPKLAFSFALLDWMEALLLECQVVIQDYCSAVEFMLKEKLNEVSAIIMCCMCGHNYHNMCQ